jgi:outer membrane protein insertion porin family
VTVQEVDLPGAPSRARAWLGRFARVAAGGLVLFLLLLLLAHSSPMRGAVLRWAVRTVGSSSGLTLRAGELTYNLLALRLSLTAVQVASRDTPDVPLLTADRIDVSLPSSVLLGRLSIDRLRGDNVRVSILRRLDGTTNLPSSGADTGEPQALAIRLIEIPRLTVDVRDEPSATSIAFPALSVNVTPVDGSVRSIEPAMVRSGDGQTVVSSIGGGLAFDGRAITLSRFAATAPEADVVLDGALALLVREPRMDLRVAGRANLEPLARWAAIEPEVGGQVSLDGTVAGPLAAPVARVRLRSDRIGWDRVGLSALSAAVVVTPDRLDLSGFEATFASGRLSATAGYVFATGVSELATTWAGLRLDTISSLLAPASPPPAGVATGSASIRLAGTGADPASLTVEARNRIDGAPGGRQLAVPGRAALQVADGRWRLEADHDIGTVPTRIAAGGRLDADFTRLMRSTIDGTIVLGDTDLPRALRAWRTAGLVDAAEGVPSGGRAEGTVVVSGTFAAPHFAIRGTARDLAVAGVSDIDADLAAEGPAERLAIDLRARQGGTNAVQISGELRPAARRIETSITGTLAQPGALFEGVPVTGAIALQFQGGGPFTAIEGRATLAGRGLTYDGFRIGAADATVTIGRDRVSADVVAPELGARLQAGLPSGGTRRVSGDLRVDDADLARLFEGGGSVATVAGRISLTVHADAPLDDWRDGEADLVVTALNATVGELSAGLTQPARASYRNRALEVASVDATIGATRLSVTGRLPVFAATSPTGGTEVLTAVLNGDLADVVQAARAAGVADVSGLSARGAMRVTARAAGAVERPIVTGDLEVGPSEIAVGEWPAVRALELRGRLADGWFDDVMVFGEWQDSLISGEARVPLRLLDAYLPAAVIAATPPTSGPATLTARALSIRPAVLEPFLDPGTLAQIDGVVEASARIEAPSLELDDVRGELRLDRLDVRVAGLPVAQREPTRITIGRGLAQVAGWDWSGQGATLNVQGQLRLADGESAILAGGQMDLRMLTPFVRDAGLTLAGTLTPRVAVAGPLGSPRFSGEVTLAAGDMRLRDPRVIATELAGSAILLPAGARITSVTGVINGGALTLAGEVSFGAAAPVVRLSAQATGMGLEFPAGLRSELDADVALALEDVAGTLGGNVTGAVTVRRSNYREPLAVVRGLLAALRAQRLSAGAGAEDDLARRVALDVRVSTDADVMVDNNLARLQLGGDLRAIGTLAAPSLAGRATLREGGQLFLGPNVYTIDAGTIDFANPDVIEPDMQVQAMTRAGGHDISLTLTGTPETLDVGLRSLTVPELGEADVASLLLTGRVLAEVPGAEGQIVGQQVLGYLSGDLLGVTSRAVGLDTIRLGGVESAALYRDPAAVAAATDPTTRLTFGKSLGNTVDVTYSQSLREGDAQTWIIDYTPLPRLGLRLVSGDDTLRSYEFRHDVTVGGGGSQKSEAAPEIVQPRVLDVRLTGELGVPEPTLRAMLRVEPGDRFDFSEWQRDRDRLEEALLGAGRLEARVTARRDEQPAGIVLSYAVAAGPQTTIAIDGDEVGADVRRLLESAWRESVYDGFLTEEADAIVRQALAEEGYLDAVVSARITSTAAEGTRPASKTLSVAIQPGARMASRRLAVDAGDEALSRELEAWLRARGADTLAWRDPRTVEALLAAELHARGYVNAQVSIATRPENGRTAVTTVTAVPGDAFTIRDVRIAGNTHIAAPLLLDAAQPVAAGAAYAPAVVDAARERLARAYRRTGFARPRVAAAVSVDADSRAVIVTYTVEEGPRQILREIAIGGAQGIDEDVIARALRLTIGEPLGSDAWLEARARLFDTALFRRADVAVEPIGAPSENEAAPEPLRVRVTVQEWPALRLRYGLRLAEEWAADDPDTRNVTPGLSVDLTRRTLFGRAVTLGLVAEYQRRERLARMFANAPTLFGWPVETLLSLERSREEFADATLVSSRSGVSLEQRVRLARHLRLSYSYRFDRDHTFDTNPNQDPLVPSFDVTVNVARLTGTAVFDSRDDPLDSTRGWLLSSNLEYAPGSLGSEFQFVRHVSQAYYFRPWRRAVLASAARLGLATPTGGQTLIPSERFYAGGSRSVRGLAEDTLGGRDIFGSLIGGAAMVILNQELRFPIYRWLRGVGFLDAGNVYETPSAIDLGRLTSSVGAGLRIVTPFALLRADYGRVWSESGVTSGRWTFGIGQSF